MKTPDVYEPWPALSYEEFAPTAHLLHMATQAVGKIKLLSPYEPEWANVILLITSRGLTSGPIPYKSGIFSIDFDLVEHQIICTCSWGHINKFALNAMSVANLTKTLLDTLNRMGIDVIINPKPQEIPNPILFHEDTIIRPYNAALANAWWRILVSTYNIMQRYHAKFLGKTPPIGLMWGTFDLRDARYNGTRIVPTGPNTGYLRRNAMDEAQIEIGWWHGNPSYQRPAYYSFTYTQPIGIEDAKVNPTTAHWEKSLGEFILDYDDVRHSKNPEADLLAFFESTYQAGAKLAGWDSKLIGSGVPI